MRISLIFLCACKVTLGDWWNDDTAPVVGVVAVTPEQKGELGQRNFTYTCIDPLEQTCLGVIGSPVPFPKRVAAGSRFILTGTPNGTRFLESKDDAIAAKDAGMASLSVQEAGRVADFLHLRVSKATGMTLLTANKTAPAAMMHVGDTQQVVAMPTADGVNLAGHVGARWSSSNPAVLSVPSQASQSALLTAATGGTATVTFGIDGATGAFVIEVQP